MAQPSGPRARPRSLLVNFFYCHPVGHAVEALHYALGHRAADPSLRITVALNAATPATELGALCPFVDETVAVDWGSLFDDPGPEAARERFRRSGLVRDWDAVVDDARGHQPEQRAAFPGIAAYYDAAHAELAPREGWGHAGGTPPGYRPGERLRFAIPEDARRRARRLLASADRDGGDGPLMLVVPAGSAAPGCYPSTSSWLLVLDALRAARPDLRFAIGGRLNSEGGRTRSGTTRADIDRLLAAHPGTVDAVDLPLTDLLAVAEAADVFLSPHTGLAFAVQAAGTPWLALSGGPWPEYLFFPGLPFHSVLPDLTRWDAYGGALGRYERPAETGDPLDEGPRIGSYSAARIRTDLPELVDAACRLLDGRITHEQALADLVARRLRMPGGPPLYSIDNVHTRHVTPQGRDLTNS